MGKLVSRSQDRQKCEGYLRMFKHRAASGSVAERWEIINTVAGDPAAPGLRPSADAGPESHYSVTATATAPDEM